MSAGRHVEPLAAADDRGHLLLVGHARRTTSGLPCTAMRIALAARGILVDPVGAHAERLLRMVLPDLAGGAGGEADALVDELLVPRLADAEGVHVADLHVRHHLRRRHDDGRDVLVGIDAAGGQPVADPQIVRAAGEGHGDLHFLALRLPLGEGGLQRGRSRGRPAGPCIRCATEIAWLSRLSRARIAIGIGTLFCVTLPVEIR